MGGDRFNTFNCGGVGSTRIDSKIKEKKKGGGQVVKLERATVRQ